MKYIFTMLYLLIIANAVWSQTNLIPNGGFEMMPSQYHGGTDPVHYYTAGSHCNIGQQRFEDDMEHWFVAATAAPMNEWAEQPSGRRCSPDWVAPTALDLPSFCTQYHSSFFVASGNVSESIMVEMANGHKLIKGQLYKFKIKARAIRGSGSFQVVFSSDSEGLDCNVNKKWVAINIELPYSNCEWYNFEYYFNVPNDNDNLYEDMKYMVLQYNQDQESTTDFGVHYDDVFLTTVPSECEEIKYIQDWQYYGIHKIEQANQEIRAGANVSPNAWEANNPVIVKSNAKVIYRAPTVYLEPGFFIEEPGSYFETQDGTCVADPCPPIPPFTGPTGTLCGPVVLGSDLPETLPGVFYSWEPSQYFSDPWSKVTTFSPPANQQSGCIDAKLVIWTICGAAQTYNFPVKYFNQAANVTLTNFQDSPTGTSVTANITNASSYTLTLLDQNGQIINEETVVLSCPTLNVVRNISFQNCDYNMCGNKTIKVVAHNDCFPDDIESVVHLGGSVPNPVIVVSEHISNDYNHSFKVNVNSNTEYVTVELLDAVTLVPVGCTKTYNHCTDAPITKLSWSSSDCNTPDNCPSLCKNHKIRITYKNQCNSTIETYIIDWIKTNPSPNQITVAGYPNIITPDGGGVNDELCFYVTGADSYWVDIIDRWGIPVHSEAGCVNSNPVCVWDGGLGYSGVYYYTIHFSNSCGAADVEHTDFVQIPTGMIINNNPQEDNASGDLLIEMPNNTEDPLLSNQTANNPASLSDEQMEVSIFPNPVEDRLYIRSKDVIKTVTVRDINGKNVFQKDAASFIDCSNLAQGVYIVEVETNTTVVLKKFVKK